MVNQTLSVSMDNELVIAELINQIGYHAKIGKCGTQIFPGCFSDKPKTEVNMEFKEMDLFLIALQNYREHKIIQHADKAKIFVWYVNNIHKRNSTIKITFPFLVQEFRSYSKGSDLSKNELKHTERKALEYLNQAQRRLDKLSGIR